MYRKLVIHNIVKDDITVVSIRKAHIVNLQENLDSSKEIKDIFDTKDKFEISSLGYKEAVSWLKEIGKWEYISTHGFSVDGYSIVETANSMWKKQNNGD